MSSTGEDVEGVADEATLLDGEQTLSLGLGVLTLCAVVGESVPSKLSVEKSVVLVEAVKDGREVGMNDGISCLISFSSFT